MDALADRADPIAVIGVAGVGKTTFGRALADALGRPFLDADDFHSAEARAQMAAGVPLTDDDRAPWLARLNVALKEKPNSVLACSALKQAYRDQLSAGVSPVFIALIADKEVIAARLRARTGHFFHPALLDNQLALFELPDRAMKIDAAAPLEDQLAIALASMRR